MPTNTEKRIIQQRNAETRGDILLPILEELLEEQCDVEDDEDFAFLQMLMRARAIPREKGVFSPSMLGSCIRQAYFAKRGEKKIMPRNPQTNAYFITGNFIHLKWQFALFKAHRKGLLELVMVPSEFPGGGYRYGVEVRVVDGEFGGTIDAIVRINGVVYIVDFKGINLIEFQRTVKRGAKEQYRKQIVGYGKIANTVLDLGIEECLLVYECKAGPLQGRGSPIALHETRVPIKDFSGEVNRRLRTLRWFDGRDELPPVSCVSTRHMGFTECPFNGKCHAEVREIQRARERGAKESKRDWQVARP